MFFSQTLRFSLRFTVVSLVVCISLWVAQPSWADTVDLYVRRYLGVKEPVALKLNPEGQMRLFSAADLSTGKRFFEENCKNCHVGGSTLPDPTAPLSLEALQAAIPPRDDILSLVAFLRQPMTYDGSEETYSCRQVSESWLSDEAAANLAAFILRSAEKAPGWGNTTF
jgi:photosystem II cytochrome c550